MRRFGPKTVDHPSVGKECPACHRPFKGGDYTTLVPLGPGDDVAAQQKRDLGLFYSAVAVEVHWDCSSQEGT